uniref:Uncharacterized protein n=1 Tax=uncultured bacterium A1Q1_fos_2111 TaxID=1256563 RepID=L7W257_9BACT|nr:hypothetical protein [uncultured bacterium A1Q1_fos_2111]
MKLTLRGGVDESLTSTIRLPDQTNDNDRPSDPVATDNSPVTL